MVFLSSLRRATALRAWRSLSHSSPFFASLFPDLHQIQKTEDIASIHFKFPLFTPSPYIVKSGVFYTTTCESLNEHSEIITTSESLNEHSENTTACESVNEHGEIADVAGETKDSAGILREWGCSEIDISKIFARRASLRNAHAHVLQSKLEVLSQLGIKSSDLVKIVNCRPRFLNSRINIQLNERLEYLEEVFGSRDVLVKAITRNPSLLMYDFQNKIKPVIAMYESLGLSKDDLISALLSRPTLIPRTSLDDEKMDYIRRTEVRKDSKMYKHVVTLFAISRKETIREKVLNLEKFGLSEDEILRFIGRSPLVLTLSVDKIQRNMTFVLGTLRLPAEVVLSSPFLIYCNLERVLKPRFQLACKIEDMRLVPQIKGPLLLRAMRMLEKRFTEFFITCHPKKVAEELITTYRNAKGIRRLAESSKKQSNKGFPF